MGIFTFGHSPSLTGAMTNLLAVSLSGAAMILLTAAVRRLIFGKVSKRALSLLWVMATVKLLVPFNRGIDIALATDSVTAEYEIASAGSYSVPPSPVTLSISAGMPDFVWYIWLFGAVFTGAYFIFAHIRSLRECACSLPCDYPAEGLKKVFGIRRTVRIRISDKTDAPFTYGVLRPAVILPKIMNGDCSDIENVLKHEFAHIKRLDVVFKGVLAVCAAVHWFNPLVWLMVTLAVRDMELACDEAAVRLGKAEPADYAMTVIGMAEKRSFAPLASFAGGKPEERITEIMTVRRLRRSGLAGGIAAAGLLAAMLFVNVEVELYEVSLFSSSDMVVTEEGTALYAEEERSVYYGEEISEDTVLYAVEISEANSAPRADSVPKTALDVYVTVAEVLGDDEVKLFEQSGGAVAYPSVTYGWTSADSGEIHEYRITVDN